MELQKYDYSFLLDEDLHFFTVKNVKMAVSFSETKCNTESSYTATISGYNPSHDHTWECEDDDDSDICDCQPWHDIEQLTDNDLRELVKKTWELTNKCLICSRCGDVFYKKTPLDICTKCWWQHQFDSYGEQLQKCIICDFMMYVHTEKKYPCGHSICRRCFSKITKCPICRKSKHKSSSSDSDSSGEDV